MAAVTSFAVSKKSIALRRLQLACILFVASAIIVALGNFFGLWRSDKALDPIIAIIVIGLGGMTIW